PGEGIPPANLVTKPSAQPTSQPKWERIPIGWRWRPAGATQPACATTAVFGHGAATPGANSATAPSRPTPTGLSRLRLTPTGDLGPLAPAVRPPSVRTARFGLGAPMGAANWVLAPRPPPTNRCKEELIPIG